MKKLVLCSGMVSLFAFAGAPTPAPATAPVTPTKTEAPKKEGATMGQLLRGSGAGSKAL